MSEAIMRRLFSYDPRSGTGAALCALALSLAFTGACADDAGGAEGVDCPKIEGTITIATSRVSGTGSFDPPTKPLGRGAVLSIKGTAHHEDGLAIRQVLVAGLSATRDEFNFAKWSVEVPYETLVTSGPTSAMDQVTFKAEALDACGRRYPFAEWTVDVDPTPQIDVSGITIAVEYPSERNFLPADETTPAILTVTAEGRAAGATVTLAASGGTMRGLSDAGTIVLTAPLGAEEEGASATVLFVASVAGPQVVTATVDGQLASAIVVVAGPPKLAPHAATLVPGASLDLTIEAPAPTTPSLACSARPDPNLVVSYHGEPFDVAPVTVEPEGDGTFALHVEAPLEASEDTMVIVSCADAYGQTGTAQFNLVLPAQ
jgi:hypothetical protein